MKSHVQFVWLYESNRDVVENIKTGGVGVLLKYNNNNDDEKTHFTRLSVGKLVSSINPWKVWETCKTKQLAILLLQHMENASHITLA